MFFIWCKSYILALEKKEKKIFNLEVTPFLGQTIWEKGLFFAFAFEGEQREYSGVLFLFG